MEPSFRDGELRIALRAWAAGAPARGEVWVVEGPEGPSLKRVLGLPGEVLTVEGPHLRVDGHPVEEPWVAHPEVEDQGPFPCGSGYLVLGDNRPLSRDGRIWGPLVRGRMVARVVNPSSR